MAGGNIRDIKRRIVSVKKTQKITSALKMVAASKFKKNQSYIYKMRNYIERLNSLMANIIARNLDINNELFYEKESDVNLYLVIGSDRGLCGGFNQNIFRKLINEIPVNSDILTVGNKASLFFKKTNHKILASFTGLSDKIDDEEISIVIEKFLELYKTEKYAKVIVYYNEFKSILAQNIVSEELLPIDINDFKEIEVTEKNEYTMEPSPSFLLETLTKKYLYAKLQKYLLESSTAEQGARMTAMESATDNAQDLIHNLTLLYNRARQSAITTELTEIVAGAESMNA
jgi:F-type H+-transporting ATPase subunit gamma